MGDRLGIPRVVDLFVPQLRRIALLILTHESSSAIRHFLFALPLRRALLTLTHESSNAIRHCFVLQMIILLITLLSVY